MGRNRDALHNIALYKFPILFYSILMLIRSICVCGFWLSAMIECVKYCIVWLPITFVVICVECAVQSQSWKPCIGSPKITALICSFGKVYRLATARHRQTDTQYLPCQYSPSYCVRYDRLKPSLFKSGYNFNFQTLEITNYDNIQ